MGRVGSYFTGSPNGLETTLTANYQVIPENFRRLGFYRFSFSNDQPCRIRINNNNPFWIRAGQGFNSDLNDEKIYSFIILEQGITFNWAGAY